MTPGYILKLERAAHHLRELESQEENRKAEKKYKFIDEADPDGEFQRRVRIVSIEPLPADPFSLIIGDALHSLRSCLDNLAYDLNGGAIPESDSEFPIFGNQNRYGAPLIGKTDHKAQFDKKTKGMDSAAKSIIERMQPYNLGNDYAGHALWKLNTLCNMDKHRAIHVVAVTQNHVAWLPHLSKNFGSPGNFAPCGGILTDNSIIMRYTPDPLDPSLPVIMYYEPVPLIGFADGPGREQRAHSLLTTIYDYVNREVIGPLAKFL